MSRRGTAPAIGRALERQRRRELSDLDKALEWPSSGGPEQLVRGLSLAFAEMAKAVNAWVETVRPVFYLLGESQREIAVMNNQTRVEDVADQREEAL